MRVYPSGWKWRRGYLPVLLLTAGIVTPPGAAQTTQYLGSQVCLSCHPDKQTWRNSMHATGLKRVNDNAWSLRTGYGIVADTDGNGVDDFQQGLDLNDIHSGFDRFKPYAPVLGYDAGSGYSIRIGTVKFPVRFAYGGSGEYRQLYGVKIPVVDRPSGWSAGDYISPVQYNELSHQFVPYRPEAWYNEDGTPRQRPGMRAAELPQSVSFDRSCAGCHFTNTIVSRDADGEWVASAPPTVYYPPNDPHVIDFNGDGYREQANIGCERCHGPGLAHVVSSGDPRKIINPARDFTAEQENQLCGSCHSNGHSQPAGIFDYPFDEAAQQSYATNLGADLFGKFFRSLPELWPDQETSRGYRQQFQDFRTSAKWQAGLRCSVCHDPHADTRYQLRTKLTVPGSSGLPVTIPVQVNDNTECLACHAGRGDFTGLRPEDLLEPEQNRPQIAAVVTGHTHHPYKPEEFPGLSRCTECHMAKLAQDALPYDTPTHTFRVVPPEATLRTREQGGMPSSCAVRCHRNYAPVFGLPLDKSLTDWTEDADIQVAEWLNQYYGPAGAWWKTELKTDRTADGSGRLHRENRARRR